LSRARAGPQPDARAAAAAPGPDGSGHGPGSLPGDAPAPDPTRLAVVLASGLVCAVWSHLYDRLGLPPRFDLGTFGLVLGGDVLPMLVTPLAFVWLVLGEPAGRYGWRARPLLPMLRDALGAWLALLPFVLFLSTQPEFQAFYPSPQFPPARIGLVGVAVNLVVNIAPQMLAGEFLYRGYLLLPLARRLGFGLAVAALLVPYVLLHAAKPGLEMLLALAGGFAFSWVAWRHRSFLPAFLAHWLVAATMDLFCFLQLRAS